MHLNAFGKKDMLRDEGQSLALLVTDDIPSLYYLHLSLNPSYLVVDHQLAG